LEELETTTGNRDFGIAHKRFDKRRDGVSEVVYCESPFEEQVVEFLENRGYEVRCQFGVQRPDGLGSFRIDIVVVENGYPIIAVECDGAAYHRSLSARTRDRAGQAPLEKPGWNFHRVWSTNWWLFQEAEKEALISAIPCAQRQSAPTRSAPAFGSSHSIAARAEATIPNAQKEPLAPRPSPTSPPAAKSSPPLQPALLDELGELFSEKSAPALKAEIAPVKKPAVANEQGLPVLLQDWSRRPGWPDAVVGRRVQWRGTWGIVTRLDRGGKSVFFRVDHSREELELPADFIRMRSGSDQ